MEVTCVALGDSAAALEALTGRIAELEAAQQQQPVADVGSSGDSVN